MYCIKIVILLLVALVAGCATMINGKTQDVEVSTIPPGLEVRIGDSQCISPCTLKSVSRNSEYIVVTHKGRETSHAIEKTYLARYVIFGNLWNLVVPGLAVDHQSGGARYINPINLDFVISENSKKVVVAKGDPPDNYMQIGSVTGVSGGGCGLMGYRGSYEESIEIIKNNAAAMGADYVQIMDISYPKMAGSCYSNVFTINGMAHKKISDKPSAVPIAITTPIRIEKSLTEKLQEIEQLKSDKLLSEQEYQEQRRKVLSQ